jgi:hypothetical protein
MVHGNAAARWLPSRHNFALFRLLAWLRLRNAHPEPAPVILGIDRRSIYRRLEPPKPTADQ